MMPRVIMVRHAATAWNEAGRYQGRADPPLSAAGQASAETVGQSLAGTPVSLVVASPLRRASETAQAIARRHAIPVQHDPALVEIDYGAWEGLTQPEVKQRWPGLLRQWKRAPAAVRFPDGETLAEASGRLRGFLARLSARVEPGATVAVVTHQTMIRLALLESTGRPLDALRDADAGTATLHPFTCEDGQLRVPSLGDMMGNRITAWNVARGLAIMVALLAVPARAQPWIPPAGSGAVKATVRLYNASRSFSSHSFGVSTYPRTSQIDDRQLRVGLVYGLGDGWAFNYYLRGDDLRKTKHGKTASTTGLQNQYIGLSHALRQSPSFADAVSLFLITPTLTHARAADPTLGVNRTAFEALYEVGVAGRLGGHPVFASLALGPWVYPQNGVVQLRSSLEVGIGVVRHLTVIGTLFLSRTAIGTRPTLASNPTNAEFYDMLRGGVALEYALRKTVRPFIGYQKDLAGENISAGHRAILGVSWRF